MDVVISYRSTEHWPGDGLIEGSLYAACRLNDSASMA